MISDVDVKMSESVACLIFLGYSDVRYAWLRLEEMMTTVALVKDFTLLNNGCIVVNTFRATKGTSSVNSFAGSSIW